MRHRYSPLFALALLLALAPAAHSATGYDTNLIGSNEVPPNASPATASATFVLDNSQTQLTYNVTFSGLTSGLTASHIHLGAFGVNGGIVFTLTTTLVNGLTAGSYSGVITGLTPANVSDLTNNLYYINIHTTTFTGGEIRGQLSANPTPSRTSTWGRIKALYR